MAWIKIRSELQSHPKVVRILSATSSDKFRVIGGLHAVWSVFDQHSINGDLFGYTPDTMDHIIGWPGFSKALMAVGWLEFDGAETLALPEFDEHNSAGAKRRAEDQKRKRNERNNPQTVREECGQNADKMRTREEKIREESIGVSDRPKSSSKGTRLPADFKMPPDWILWAMESRKDLTPAGIQLEADKFKDYWLSRAGAGGSKVDWLATWRNWMRATKTNSAPATMNRPIAAKPFI